MVKIAYLAQHRRGLRELLEQLSETGYSVYRVDPTVMAYNRLRDDMPDIVIADATLRDGHVLEVLQALGASRITKPIPICVVGCRPDNIDDLRAAAPNARNFLCGEVTRKLLVELVKELVIR
jgi:response regulator RpfG family c-di-GMP phosphodiesterase